jgi:twitching motility protein PilT
MNTVEAHTSQPVAVSITDLLRMCRQADNAASISDVHIVQNGIPWLRRDGVLEKYEALDPFADEEIKEFYESNLSQTMLEMFQKENSVTTSVHSKEFGDIRIHVIKKNDGTDLIIRLLNMNVPSIQKLNLPKILPSFADTPNGLYLFSGPTGSGKSTALAALIHEINKRHPYAIFTVEDPIEYKHTSMKSLVRQLAIGQDTPSYASAIRSFLRSDPDVILLGEMRDSETMLAGLRAAETGHLVFSTVHDNGAAETCQRICGSFGGDQAEQVKLTFASVVRGVVSLRLVTTAKGEGRIPACEIMIMNDAIKNQIKRSEFQQIRGSIQQGKKEGMQTFEDDLNRMLADGLITRETALENANNKAEIRG